MVTCCDDERVTRRETCIHLWIHHHFQPGRWGAHLDERRNCQDDERGITWRFVHPRPNRGDDTTPGPPGRPAGLPSAGRSHWHGQAQLQTGKTPAEISLVSRGADLRGWLPSLAGVGAFPAVVTAGLRRRSGAELGWMSLRMPLLPPLGPEPGGGFFGSSGGPPRTTNYGCASDPPELEVSSRPLVWQT